MCDNNEAGTIGRRLVLKHCDYRKVTAQFARLGRLLFCIDKRNEKSADMLGALFKEYDANKNRSYELPIYEWRDQHPSLIFLWGEMAQGSLHLILFQSCKIINTEKASTDKVRHN